MKKLGGSWELVGSLVIAAWLLGSVTQAEAETLKWRQSGYTHKVEVIEVGEVPGHLVGAGEIKGIAFFENGETATYLTKFTIDYINGSGPHQAYTLYTFEDGSTFVIKIQGTTTAEPSRKIS